MTTLLRRSSSNSESYILELAPTPNKQIARPESTVWAADAGDGSAAGAEARRCSGEEGEVRLEDEVMEVLEVDRWMWAGARI